MTSIVLDPEIDRWLGDVAGQSGRSKDETLREAIRRGLEDLEDIQNADEVMDRLKRGEERVLSEQDVRRNLGLEN